MQQSVYDTSLPPDIGSTLTAFGVGTRCAFCRVSSNYEFVVLQSLRQVSPTVRRQGEMRVTREEGGHA